jgi:hypothetical protein
MGDAIAMSIVGAVVALFVAVQLWRSVTFGTNPPVRFARKDDPFGFWLNILILSALAAFLLVFGLIGLYHEAIH